MMASLNAYHRSEVDTAPMADLEHELARVVFREPLRPDVHEVLIDALFALRRLSWSPQPRPLAPFRKDRDPYRARSAA